MYLLFIYYSGVRSYFILFYLADRPINRRFIPGGEMRFFLTERTQASNLRTARTDARNGTLFSAPRSGLPDWARIPAQSGNPTLDIQNQNNKMTYTKSK